MPQLRILGPLDLIADDGRSVESVLAQPKRMALLSYLALEGRGGTLRRDLLLTSFWPESDDARGRGSLRRSIHFLRKALGPGLIIARGDAIGLAPGAIQCDAVTLMAELEAGRLEEAVELYRGDLLAGIHLRGNGEFEDWLSRERERLRSLVGSALWTLADRAVESGDSRAGAHWSARAVALTPYDEGVQRRRIALLRDLGDHAGALRAYDEFAGWLAREYQGTPSPETRLLADSLRAASTDHDGPPRLEPSERAESSELAPLSPPPSARWTPETLVAPEPPADEPLEMEPAPPEESTSAQIQPNGTASAPPQGPRPHPLPARLPRRRMVWGAVGALVAVGAMMSLMAGVVLLRPDPSVAAQGSVLLPPRGDETRLLVLPFTVHGEERLDYLGDGLVDLLSTGLDGIGALRTVDPHAVLGRLPSLRRDSENLVATGIEAAGAFDAELFVAGSVVQAGGGRLELRASLYGRDGALVATSSAGANETELTDAVDELTRQLLAGRYDTPGQQLARLAVRTTSSMDALRAYLAGTQLLRQGKFAQAADSQRAAIAADSGFALAYHGLSMALGWFSYGGDREATIAAGEAVRRSAELGPRAAATLRAHHASWNGRPDEADRLYREILSSYPDDVDALNGLAELVFHEGGWRGRTPGDAADAFEHVEHIPALTSGVLLHLARIAASERDVTRLDSIATRMRNASNDRPGDGRLQEVEALHAFVIGGAAARRAVLERVGRQSDARIWQMAWSVARFASAWDDAESLLMRLTTRDRPAGTRGPAWLGIATLRAAAGRPESARAALDSAANDDPGWAALARAELAALPFLPASAEELAHARASLLATNEHPRPAQGAIPTYMTVALRDRAGGRAMQALDLRRSFAAEWPYYLNPGGMVGPDERHISSTEPVQPAAALASLEGDWELETEPRAPFLNLGAFQRLRRGYLLAALGDAQGAERWYATIPTPDGYEVPLVAPATLARARLADSEGRTGEAIQLYERFARLWADCEPELRPLVDEARKRAETLRDEERE